MQSLRVSRSYARDALKFQRRRCRLLPWSKCAFFLATTTAISFSQNIRHFAIHNAQAFQVPAPLTRKSSSSTPSLKSYESNLKSKPTTSRYISSLKGKESNSDDKIREVKNPRQHILDRTPKEDLPVVERTLEWVEGVVIRLNLCPFAQLNNLYLEVIEGSNQVEILARVLAECMVRQKRPGTTLMICPDLFPSNFLSFLEVYNMIQDGVLVDNELSDDIQIAPFHPLFQFESSDSNSETQTGGNSNELPSSDIDNYTNRSPFPIFHILREVEVERAVDVLHGDSSKVWQRNIEVLEELENKLSPDQLDYVLSGKPFLDTQGSLRKTVDDVCASSQDNIK